MAEGLLKQAETAATAANAQLFAGNVDGAVASLSKAVKLMAWLPPASRDDDAVVEALCSHQLARADILLKRALSGGAGAGEQQAVDRADALAEGSDAVRADGRAAAVDAAAVLQALGLPFVDPAAPTTESVPGSGVSWKSRFSRLPWGSGVAARALLLSAQGWELVGTLVDAAGKGTSPWEVASRVAAEAAVILGGEEVSAAARGVALGELRGLGERCAAKTRASVEKGAERRAQMEFEAQAEARRLAAEAKMRAAAAAEAEMYARRDEALRRRAAEVAALEGARKQEREAYNKAAAGPRGLVSLKFARSVLHARFASKYPSANEERKLKAQVDHEEATRAEYPGAEEEDEEEDEDEELGPMFPSPAAVVHPRVLRAQTIGDATFLVGLIAPGPAASASSATQEHAAARLAALLSVEDYDWRRDEPFDDVHLAAARPAAVDVTQGGQVAAQAQQERRAWRRRRKRQWKRHATQDKLLGEERDQALLRCQDVADVVSAAGGVAGLAALVTSGTVTAQCMAARALGCMALNDEEKDTSEAVGTWGFGAALAALITMCHSGSTRTLCALHALCVLLREERSRRAFLQVTLRAEAEARERERGLGLTKGGSGAVPHRPAADGIGMLLFFCDLEPANSDLRKAEMLRLAQLAVRTLSAEPPALAHVIKRREEQAAWRAEEMRKYLAYIERLRRLLAAGLRNHHLRLCRWVLLPWIAYFRVQQRLRVAACIVIQCCARKRLAVRCANARRAYLAEMERRVREARALRRLRNLAKSVEAMRANALAWRERKRLAAITIQAGWRGLQGRRKAERRRRYLIEMERRVQLQRARHNARLVRRVWAAWLQLIAERVAMNAATMLQKYARRWAAVHEWRGHGKIRWWRRRAAEWAWAAKCRRDYAATVKAWAGFMTLMERRDAAWRIECAYRQYLARLELARRRARLAFLESMVVLVRARHARRVKVRVILLWAREAAAGVASRVPALLAAAREKGAAHRARYNAAIGGIAMENARAGTDSESVSAAAIRCAAVVAQAAAAEELVVAEVGAPPEVGARAKAADRELGGGAGSRVAGMVASLALLPPQVGSLPSVLLHALEGSEEEQEQGQQQRSGGVNDRVLAAEACTALEEYARERELEQEQRKLWRRVPDEDSDGEDSVGGPGDLVLPISQLSTAAFFQTLASVQHTAHLAVGSNGGGGGGASGTIVRGRCAGPFPAPHVTAAELATQYAATVAPYAALRKVGVDPSSTDHRIPESAIKLQMEADGISQRDIYAFFTSDPGAVIAAAGGSIDGADGCVVIAAASAKRAAEESLRGAVALRPASAAATGFAGVAGAMRPALALADATKFCLSEWLQLLPALRLLSWECANNEAGALTKVTEAATVARLLRAILISPAEQSARELEHAAAAEAAAEAAAAVVAAEGAALVRGCVIKEQRFCAAAHAASVGWAEAGWEAAAEQGRQLSEKEAAVAAVQAETKEIYEELELGPPPPAPKAPPHVAIFRRRKSLYREGEYGSGSCRPSSTSGVDDSGSVAKATEETARPTTAAAAEAQAEAAAQRQEAEERAAAAAEAAAAAAAAASAALAGLATFDRNEIMRLAKLANKLELERVELEEHQEIAMQARNVLVQALGRRLLPPGLMDLLTDEEKEEAAAHAAAGGAASSGLPSTNGGEPESEKSSATAAELELALQRGVDALEQVQLAAEGALSDGQVALSVVMLRDACALSVDKAVRAWRVREEVEAAAADANAAAARAARGARRRRRSAVAEQRCASPTALVELLLASAVLLGDETGAETQSSVVAAVLDLLGHARSLRTVTLGAAGLLSVGALQVAVALGLQGTADGPVSGLAPGVGGGRGSAIGLAAAAAAATATDETDSGLTAAQELALVPALTAPLAVHPPSSHLSSLSLENNAIGSGGAVALFAALMYGRSSSGAAGGCRLTKLNLSHNAIGDGAGPTLAAALAAPCPGGYLRELNLAGNNLGSPAVEDIAVALALGTALPAAVAQTVVQATAWAMGGAENGGSEAPSATRPESSCCALTSLSLTANPRIGDPGGVALSAALRTNRGTLRRLDLSGTSIGDATAMAFAELLQYRAAEGGSTSAVFGGGGDVLWLRDCAVGDAGAEALGEAVSRAEAVAARAERTALEQAKAQYAAAIAAKAAAEEEGTLPGAKIYEPAVPPRPGPVLDLQMDGNPVTGNFRATLPELVHATQGTASLFPDDQSRGLIRPWGDRSGTGCFPLPPAWQQTGQVEERGRLLDQEEAQQQAQKNWRKQQRQHRQQALEERLLRSIAAPGTYTKSLPPLEAPPPRPQDLQHRWKPVEVPLPPPGQQSSNVVWLDPIVYHTPLDPVGGPEEVAAAKRARVRPSVQPASGPM